MLAGDGGLIVSARYGSPTGVTTHYGNTGLGGLGSTVPSGGDAGASYLYNDLTLPADNNVEVQGLIVTPPSAGTFFPYEDGSFTLIGAPDGVSTFVYRLIADGVNQGTATATITTAGGVSAVTVTVAVLGLVVGTVSATAVVSSTAAPLSNAEMRQMFGWVSDLARIHGLILGQPLVVTPTQRSAGAVVQTISEAGTTVTVALQ